MKKTKEMNGLRREYISPISKVHKIRAHGPLCTSSGGVNANSFTFEENSTGGDEETLNDDEI